MAHWEHEARRLYEENAKLKRDQESLIAERGQFARAADEAEARIEIMVRYLREHACSLCHRWFNGDQGTIACQRCAPVRAAILGTP